jgi:hypothetical protein
MMVTFTNIMQTRDRCVSDRVVARVTTTCAISAYCHYNCDSNPVHDEVILQYDRKCGRSRFSLGTPGSSSNKPHRHDITEILLEVTLNTILPILIKITYVRGSQVVRFSILIKGHISAL